LLWIFVDDEAAFQTVERADWVSDWVARRRKNASPAATISESNKSLDAALPPQSENDPEVAARKRAASKKRAEETRRSVTAATEDLDMWIADQLRTGLAGFLGALNERCRRIAARLVDAKAGALAGRLDEMPSRLLALPGEERIDAAIIELGKLVLLTRAWRSAPEAPDLRREVVGAETRDDVLADPKALRVSSLWEVAGQQIQTRRDGLISQATWLLNLREGPRRFAALLDFFPASAGRRNAAFEPGERFAAEIAYYPGDAPLRAVIAARDPSVEIGEPWPEPPAEPFSDYAESLLASPWRIEAPVLLPEGRVCRDDSGRAWWRSKEGPWTAPLREPPPLLALGAVLENIIGLWDGMRLAPLAAQTNWGRLDFNA
jgi:hypothetical protein